MFLALKIKQFDLFSELAFSSEDAMADLVNEHGRVIVTDDNGQERYAVVCPEDLATLLALENAIDANLGAKALAEVCEPIPLNTRDQLIKGICS